jgi:drug/metabolite transporter (DMT)-like permease
MWFIYALIAGVFFAINSLMIRQHFRKNEDQWVFSFYFSFIIGLCFLPLLLTNFSLPTNINFWVLTLLICVTLLVGNLMSFTAAKTIGATTANVVGKLRLLWLIIVGIFLFNESMNLQKIIGMILILSASFLIIDYSKWKVSRKGVILIILTTVTSTIYAILLKKIIATTDIFHILFIGCMIQAALNALITPNFFQRAKNEFKNIKWLIMIGVIGAIANFAIVKALSYDVLSGAYFVMDASLVILIFGEHFILKEKERLWWKASALILAIIGAILIHGI